MMDDLSNPKRLLLYRKVTRTISEHIRGQLRGYLATLSPLLRPRMVLGEYIQGNRLSFAYWCLNPDGFYGGLLGGDWATVQSARHDAIKPYLAPLIP